MGKIFHRPFILFAITSTLLAVIFFIFPINLFDGELVIERGLQSMTVEHSLSLSNFIGIGTDGMDEQGIVDFYLTAKGIILACIIILGLPALFAYRMYLKVTPLKGEA